jgi:hypothetical protein
MHDMYMVPFSSVLHLIMSSPVCVLNTVDDNWLLYFAPKFT